MNRSRPAELESILGMDINVHRVSTSLTNFPRDNSVAHENRIYEGLRDFSEFLHRFRGASSKDARWAKETQRAFNGAADLIYQIVEQEKRKQDGLKKTVELRLSTDKVLDEEVQKDIQDRLVKTTQGLLDVGGEGVALVFSLLGIALVVSVIAVLVTARSISWPMQRLKTAIDRLGQGDLSRRIEVSADHEMGHLALAFNRMAEDLQRNTVSRAYVEGIFCVMSESLIVVSPDSLIETVNPAACNLLGYKETELVGMRFENVCRAWSEVADRVRRGGAREYEVSYLTRDGRDVPVLCTANAMHAAAENSDALDAIVIVAIDITERKRAEQELTESQMRLRELARHLNATIEADRTRIAREIHDQLGQALTGLKNAAVLGISDNGRGISLEQIGARQSLGLLGMQERARELGGTVMIDGKPGEGTLVQVRIPMALEQALRGPTGEDSAGSP
ncbi:MAG: PAS domain S-box protein [Gammaproteobacteria bacterium]